MFGLDFSVYVINLIIGVILFALLRWAFKKIIRHNNSLRVFLTWFSTIILTPLVYVSLITSFILFISYYPKKKFDESVWRLNKENRYEMTDDLIDRKLLIGKTKEEVKRILGQDYFKYSVDHWAYDVSFVPSLGGIDPDVLDVFFKNGKVEKVNQHET